MTKRLSVASIVEECRAFSSASIKLQSSHYARTVGLRFSTQQFENDIIEAVVIAVSYHLAPKPKKFSDLRKQMVRVDKAAMSAAKKLRLLQSALDQVEPIYRTAMLNQLPKLLAPPFTISHNIEALSNKAHLYSRGFATKGGTPKMIEFGMLVKHLATAFQRAVGRAAKVTWNAHDQRYEGKFVNFVEAALPIAIECAQRLGPRLRCPVSARARGEYISELTRSARKVIT
jgi:hypothetical protein